MLVSDPGWWPGGVGSTAVVVSDQCGLDALFLQLDVDEGSRAVLGLGVWVDAAVDVDVVRGGG